VIGKLNEKKEIVVEKVTLIKTVEEEMGKYIHLIEVQENLL
jgi:hypothetical protein